MKPFFFPPRLFLHVEKHLMMQRPSRVLLFRIIICGGNRNWMQLLMGHTHRAWGIQILSGSMNSSILFTVRLQIGWVSSDFVWAGHLH